MFQAPSPQKYPEARHRQNINPRKQKEMKQEIKLTSYWCRKSMLGGGGCKFWCFNIKKTLIWFKIWTFGLLNSLLGFNFAWR